MRKESCASRVACYFGPAWTDYSVQGKTSHPTRPCLQSKTSTSITIEGHFLIGGKVSERSVRDGENNDALQIYNMTSTIQYFSPSNRTCRQPPPAALREREKGYGTLFFSIRHVLNCDVSTVIFGLYRLVVLSLESTTL